MQYKRSHRCVLLYPLYTLLVLPHCVSVSICMCWCVRRTDCTPPQCSPWPPRPSAPICVVLLLPSVEVKTQKKNRRTWHCGRSLSQGSDSQAAEMMKMEPAPLSLLLCVCVCVFVWKPSGYICQVDFAANSESYMHRSPHTHTHTHTQNLRGAWQHTHMCLSDCIWHANTHSLPRLWRSFVGINVSRCCFFSLHSCILCIFDWVTPEIVNGRERTTGKGLHQSSSLDTLLDSLEIGKRTMWGRGQISSEAFCTSWCEYVSTTAWARLRFCASTPEHPRAFVNLKMLAACQTR